MWAASKLACLEAEACRGKSSSSPQTLSRMIPSAGPQSPPDHGRLTCESVPRLAARRRERSRRALDRREGRLASPGGTALLGLTAKPLKMRWMLRNDQLSCALKCPSRSEQRGRGEHAYAPLMGSPPISAPSCPHCRGSTLRNTRPSRSGCYRICSGCNHLWHVTGEALRAEKAPLRSRRRAVSAIPTS